MDNSRQNIFKEIAQELECGNDCYYNPKTNELITIPNFGEMLDEDEFRESFGAELDKVTKGKAKWKK